MIQAQNGVGRDMAQDGEQAFDSLIFQIRNRLMSVRQLCSDSSKSAVPDAEQQRAS